MGKPLISIIVPVYNVEPYLAPCLDSILSQSYKQLEVIVINDGSSDFSLKIAESYAEKDNRINVYSYENEGLAEARNRGIEHATGDLFVFVDSDDLLLPNAVEILCSFLLEKEADLVVGDFIRGKVYTEIKPPVSIKSKTFNHKEAIADVLYQKYLRPSFCGAIFRRKLFDSLRFEKGILYEDLNLFYRVFDECHKIVKIDYPVYFYRITESSILNSWKPQRLDVLKVTENIENYIAEKYPDILPAAKDRRLSANFNMFALCEINNDKENADRCWKLIKKNRKESLLNPKVRFKNKSGIILSYFGKNVFKFFSRIVY
ncbi:MAG: glycosyltransferase family 2 protein [Muribaculaceae bacterium]|nr:glycosyltransferase family 2 protein [Muribaculaceae bacterium]